MLAAVNTIVGLLLLFLGRRLFWFFVAAVGFAAGIRLAPALFDIQGGLAAVLIGLLAGAIGAGLALFLQTLAIGVAGFLAGGMFVNALLSGIGWETGWLPFLLGGIVGASLVAFLFDWALIILSSLLGAQMIATQMNLGEPGATAALVGLAAFGVLVQTWTMNQYSERETRSTE